MPQTAYSFLKSCNLYKIQGAFVVFTLEKYLNPKCKIGSHAQAIKHKRKPQVKILD